MFEVYDRVQHYHSRKIGTVVTVTEKKVVVLWDDEREAYSHVEQELKKLK